VPAYHDGLHRRSNLAAPSIVRNGMIEKRRDLGVRPMLGPTILPGGQQAARAAAFRELTDRQLDASYRLATLLLGNRVDAEDATHDAAVVAWQRWSSLRDPERFAAWFQRILVNVCRDRLRRRRVREVEIVPEQADPPGLDPFDGSVERAALLGALAHLTPEHRMVVVLRYYADLGIEEIADRTGERTGTVKSRLHYALSELRAAYDAAERTPGESVR
jgi:RNA polymerase sigma factor (sigma-70 family)